jgi:hypothetical protein
LSIRVDIERARQLFSAAREIAETHADPAWEARIQHLSEICEKSNRTHIAFVGTALLAKATNQDVNVFAIKAKANTPGAYSARSVVQHALVPEARRLKVDIGVTGKEPLNNQPYFHNSLVSRQMVVHSTAHDALNAVCDILEHLAVIRDPDQTLSALAAYIKVRRSYWKPPAPYSSPEAAMALTEFVQLIEDFVLEDSEGGRRAQAIAAGLMDAFQDGGVVETGRINDPSRELPGDIEVYDVLEDESTVLRMLIEVRDKAVSEGDVDTFAARAAIHVGRAAVLAVALGQGEIDIKSAQRRAAEHGLDLQVFVGWSTYARQVFFWSPEDAAKAIRAAHSFVYERLIELECSPRSLRSWLEWRPPGASA